MADILEKYRKRPAGAPQGPAGMPAGGDPLEKYRKKAPAPAAPGSTPEDALDERGVSVTERALLGNVEPDPASAVKWLEGRGYEAKATAKGVAVRRPGEPWKRVDPEAAELLDVADVGNELFSGLLTGAGAVSGGAGTFGLGSIAGGAVGAGAAESLQQAAGAALGFEKTPGGVLADVGTEAALGGATEAVLGGGGKLIRSALGRRALGKATPEAVAGRQAVTIPGEGVNRAARLKQAMEAEPLEPLREFKAPGVTPQKVHKKGLEMEISTRIPQGPREEMTTLEGAPWKLKHLTPGPPRDPAARVKLTKAIGEAKAGKRWGEAKKLQAKLRAYDEELGETWKGVRRERLGGTAGESPEALEALARVEDLGRPAASSGTDKLVEEALRQADVKVTPGGPVPTKPTQGPVGAFETDDDIRGILSKWRAEDPNARFEITVARKGPDEDLARLMRDRRRDAMADAAKGKKKAAGEKARAEALEEGRRLGMKGPGDLDEMLFGLTDPSVATREATREQLQATLREENGRGLLEEVAEAMGASRKDLELGDQDLIGRIWELQPGQVRSAFRKGMPIGGKRAETLRPAGEKAAPDFRRRLEGEITRPELEDVPTPEELGLAGGMTGVQREGKAEILPSGQRFIEGAGRERWRTFSLAEVREIRNTQTGEVLRRGAKPAGVPGAPTPAAAAGAPAVVPKKPGRLVRSADFLERALDLGTHAGRSGALRKGAEALGMETRQAADLAKLLGAAGVFGPGGQAAAGVIYGGKALAKVLRFADRAFSDPALAGKARRGLPAPLREAFDLAMKIASRDGPDAGRAAFYAAARQVPEEGLALAEEEAE